MQAWNAESLRQRFAGRSFPQTGLEEVRASASVLIPLVDRGASLGVLLTRRAEQLRHHPGQICFPGGRREGADASLVGTALREASEEIGLVPANVEVLGCLPGFSMPTGLLVTPVLGLVLPPLNLKVDPLEVAELFELPLSFLLKRCHYLQHRITGGGSLRQVHSIACQGHFIWGATAAMLLMLNEFLEGPF